MLIPIPIEIGTFWNLEDIFIKKYGKVPEFSGERKWRKYSSKPVHTIEDLNLLSIIEHWSPRGQGQTSRGLCFTAVTRRKQKNINHTKIDHKGVY